MQTMKLFTKDELWELYKVKDMTIYEIAEIRGIAACTVSKYFKKFGIKTTNEQRKFKHLKKVPLTEKQHDFVIGSLMGDASITEVGKNCRFSVTHGSSQKDYLLWKKEILGNFVNKIGETYGKKNKSGRVKYRFNTICTQEFKDYREMFYGNNKKTITDEILDKITPFSLAVWHMDDGTLKAGCNIYLSTCGFSKEAHIKMQEMFRKKFNICCKIVNWYDKKYARTYSRLYFNKENSQKFSWLIEDYVIPSMQYKIMSKIKPQTGFSTTTCVTSQADGDIVCSA